LSQFFDEKTGKISRRTLVGIFVYYSFYHKQQPCATAPFSAPFLWLALRFEAEQNFIAALVIQRATTFTHSMGQFRGPRARQFAAWGLEVCAVTRHVAAMQPTFGMW
jgi:hypothetical protein